jgi:hypothetical protein
MNLSNRKGSHGDEESASESVRARRIRHRENVAGQGFNYDVGRVVFTAHPRSLLFSVVLLHIFSTVQLELIFSHEKLLFAGTKVRLPQLCNAGTLQGKSALWVSVKPFTEDATCSCFVSISVGRKRLRS